MKGAYANMAFIVEMTRVGKSFPTPAGLVEAVREATATLKAGEVSAITGPSGSGKSTLLALIGGLDQPTSGSILVEGRDLSGTNLDLYRRRRVGFVFQSYNLLPHLSAAENVALPADLEGRKASEVAGRALDLLKDVGLDPAQASRRPARLSGGEQQRVAIARALVNDPPLILADEPTGNLDETTGAAIVDLLCGLARERGKCVVIVTHNPQLAARCDRVMVMRNGKLDVASCPRAQGSPAGARVGGDRE